MDNGLAFFIVTLCSFVVVIFLNIFIPVAIIYFAVKWIKRLF